MRLRLFLSIVLSFSLVLASMSPLVNADDYEPADEPENSTNQFLLDADNTGGDITIQFGETLAETLRWVDASNYFELSDALVVDGNMNINGTVFRIDFDNGGAGADIDILAEQGTDNDGTLRYSAANDRWELSNNGGAFEAILTGDGTEVPDRLHVVHSATQAITAGFAAVTNWDAPQVISSSSFTFNQTTGEININTAGWYMVHAQGGIANNGTGEPGNIRSTSQFQVTEDTGGGFTAVPGSSFYVYSREEFSGQTQGSVAFPRQYAVGDDIRLEVQAVDSTFTETDPGQTAFFVVSLTGPPGPQGAQGLPGTVGLGTDETSFTIDQDEAGNPDQDVDIIAEQGSENNGILRYDDGNDRWEGSNDGSTFQPFVGSGLCGSHGAFWGEEGGALNEATNGGLQFSYGNGNVNAHGPVMACSGTVVALTMNCEGGGAGSIVQIAVNGVAQGAGCQVTSTAANNFKVSDLTCGVAFSANDALAPITTGGGASGADGCTATYTIQYD